MTTTTLENKLALLAFFGDWVRDEALRRWVLDRGTLWHEVVKMLRDRYGMMDCDIGLLSHAAPPPRKELVKRLKSLVKEVDLDHPPQWHGPGPQAFVPAPVSAASLSTGWPGGPIRCLESALVDEEPAELKVGATETVTFLGWNLSGPVSLTLIQTGATPVTVDVTFTQDSCGRSRATAQVSLSAAGRWGVILGTDPKCGLHEALVVLP